jgi:hypothetical protein
METLTGLPGVDLLRYARSKQSPYQRDLNSPTFRGTYGSVFKALDPLGDCFAIKELRTVQAKRHDRSPKTTSSPESDPAAEKMQAL